MSKPYILSASILAADFAYLADDINAAIDAGIDSIHFDVMDHHFVPNLSFGAPICQSIRDAGITLPIDVHLMVTNPEHYIEPFAKAGANAITFHPETQQDPHQLLKIIKEKGLEAGLVYNPDIAVALQPEVLRDCDIILLMSVFPGFGGQSFMPEVLDKIQSTRTLLDQEQSNAKLAVDGGVKDSNIHQITEAGADFLVVGSGLFAADDYHAQVKKLRQAH